MSDLRHEVYDALVRDHGINPDSIARSLSEVIRGETVTETFDGSGNLTSRKVTTRASDKAIGLAIFDRISGGQLGIGRAIVDASRSTKELYSEFMPMIEGDESVIHRKELTVIEDDESKSD